MWLAARSSPNTNIYLILIQSLDDSFDMSMIVDHEFTCVLGEDGNLHIVLVNLLFHDVLEGLESKLLSGIHSQIFSVSFLDVGLSSLSSRSNSSGLPLEVSA